MFLSTPHVSHRLVTGFVSFDSNFKTISRRDDLEKEFHVTRSVKMMSSSAFVNPKMVLFMHELPTVQICLQRSWLVVALLSLMPKWLR